MEKEISVKDTKADETVSTIPIGADEKQYFHGTRISGYRRQKQICP